MKTLRSLRMSIFMLLALLLIPVVSFAAFESGSTGADGPLSPPTSPSTYIVPAKDNGVYNFTTVTIPAGVTVTFAKNPANTPVTVLATGDVTVNGTISVKGSNANNVTPGAGGNGGFDGGVGGFINSAGFRGQGAGGGAATSGAGGGGGFGAVGNGGSATGTNWNRPGNAAGTGGGTYGNTSLTPLIGGSGGAGGGGTSSYIGGAGGGGGGALLIASSGTIRVNTGGAITANGGIGAVYPRTNCNDWDFTYAGGGGSGGGIRLIANVITGEGTISADGGGASVNACSSYDGGDGGSGRIRLEGWQITRASNTSPPYTSLSYPTALYTANPPSLAITQINGVSTPAVTFGAFRSPDVMLPFNTTGPVTVTVTSQYIPAGKTVTVKALPESGNNVITASGTLDATGIIQFQLALSSGTSYVLSASVNY